MWFKAVFWYQTPDASGIPSYLTDLVLLAHIWLVKVGTMREFSKTKCLLGVSIEPLGD